MSRNTLRNEPRPAPYKPSAAAKVRKQSARSAKRVRAITTACWARLEMFSKKFSQVTTAPFKIAFFTYKQDTSLFFISAFFILLGCGFCGFVFSQTFDPFAKNQNADHGKLEVVLDKELSKLSNNDAYWNAFAAGDAAKIGGYLNQQMNDEYGFEAFGRDAPPSGVGMGGTYAFHAIRGTGFDDLYLCRQHSYFGIFNDKSKCFRWRRTPDKKIVRTSAIADSHIKALKALKWNTDLEGVFMPMP